MSVTETLKKYVEKYGTTVSLSSDGKVFGTPYRAFIQPLRYKNKMYLMGVRSKLGWIDQSHYLYIGPAEKDVASLTSAARIRSQNENFYIVKAENVHLGDNIFYNWAVIRAVVEDQTAQAAQPTAADTQSAADSQPAADVQATIDTQTPQSTAADEQTETPVDVQSPQSETPTAEQTFLQSAARLTEQPIEQSGKLSTDPFQSDEGQKEEMCNA